MSEDYDLEQVIAMLRFRKLLHGERSFGDAFDIREALVKIFPDNEWRVTAESCGIFQIVFRTWILSMSTRLCTKPWEIDGRPLGARSFPHGERSPAVERYLSDTPTALEVQRDLDAIEQKFGYPFLCIGRVYKSLKELVEDVAFFIAVYEGRVVPTRTKKRRRNRLAKARRKARRERQQRAL